MQTFSASRLRVLRKAKGLTQKALGESIGTTERRVRFWEAGEVEPSATYLLRIMILLNCGAKDLLEDAIE